jgi:Tol biopolymer transport system component
MKTVHVKHVLCWQLFIIFLLFGACRQEQSTETESSKKHAKIPELRKPPERSEIFSPDFISHRHDVRDMAISPDGNEIYFSLGFPKFSYAVILYTEKTEGSWSELKTAGFSGRYSDIEPAFSPDGEKMYFASKRPLEGDTEPKDWDVWFVERDNNGEWGLPVNIGDSVNTSGNEFYPSVSREGNLYFTAQRSDSKGGEDIYFSKKTSNGFSEPVNAGDSINSKYYEFNAYVSPDEDYIIFTSYGREDDTGGGDLYISYKNSDGVWKKAENMGSEINSPKLDYCPFVFADRQSFFSQVNA